ncbi:hypothetical protein S2M10_01840 [Sphingomonas sp. S2M10]|nr:hypothetical protein [Sphingomonas sp. S2M10]
MRRLGQPQRGAGEDVGACPHQLLRRGIIFLQHDSGEAIAARAMVPKLVHHPFAAVVVVVEQRGIEPARIEVDRIGPLPVDRLAGDEIVVEVAQRRARGAAHRRAAIALHIGVEQVEAGAVMRQARRPYAAAVRIAAHVELRGADQRPDDQRPVGEVAAVVDLHAGEPFEGRGRDIIVVADAADRRIGVEAGKDRIADHRGALTRVQRRRAATRSSSPRAMKKGP